MVHESVMSAVELGEASADKWISQTFQGATRIELVKVRQLY
jgi:hypothetical protein